MNARSLRTSIALLMMASTPLLADTFQPGQNEISLTYLGTSSNRAAMVYYDNGLSVYERVISAGSLEWSGGVNTFCIQLLEGITVGQTRTFDVVSVEEVPESPPAPGPMGSSRATLIRDLYARYYEEISSATGSDLKNKSAAFALVLWEITHQDSSGKTPSSVLADLDLATGNARFDSSSVVNQFANSWLDGLGGGTDDFLWFNGLVGLTDPTTQDFLTVVPGPAGMMALLGLGSLGRSRRRR